MGAAVSPVVTVTEDNGLYTMKTTSTFKSQELKFKLGEEFDEETPDGRKVKSVITLEGNKMKHVQKGDKDTVIEREFTPSEMKAVSRVNFTAIKFNSVSRDKNTIFITYKLRLRNKVFIFLN